ncbi:POL4 protein, partial [Pseudoatta argentina]
MTFHNRRGHFYCWLRFSNTFQLATIRHKRLIDGNTFLKVFAQLVNKASPYLTALADDCPYKELSKFPKITRTSITHKQVTHGMEHVTETTDPPVSNKARLGGKRNNNAKIEWTSELKQSFQRLKEHLAQATPLAFPDSKAALVYAFKRKSDQMSPRQTRQLLFISEFITDVRHVSGAENIAADALSRVDTIVMPTSFDMQEIAEAQASNDELQLKQSTSTSLKLKKFILSESPRLPKYQYQILEHVHFDIVGPLSPSKDFRYLLTMIDRFTRWSEAIPLQDCTTDTVAKMFFTHWIAKFGILRLITTDQDSQFEAQLFDTLTKLVYLSESNGIIERWHRHFCSGISLRHYVQNLYNVFLKIEDNRRFLDKPYTGPHKVLECISDKVLAIEIDGRCINATADKFKPAYLTIQDLETTPSIASPSSTNIPVQCEPKTYPDPTTK